MKILFVFPNYDCPLGLSIGVSYLSACLQEQGHQTKILHINDEIGYPFNLYKIVNDIVIYNPGLVAISTGENHFFDMLKLAEHLRSYSSVPIAFGGVHVTLNTSVVMENHPIIDFCVIGEGEDALPELVNALEKGEDTTCIQNVWARVNTTIIKNKMRPLKDITILPYMDLNGWNFKKITELRRGWVNVSMNRGCPYRCSFCHNVGEVKILIDCQIKCNTLVK